MPVCGVMCAERYGRVAGHGILMASAAYAMIHWENPIKKFKEGGEV